VFDVRIRRLAFARLSSIALLALLPDLGRSPLLLFGAPPARTTSRRETALVTEGTTMMDRLPLELVKCIFAELNTWSAKSCSLVCKAWSRLARSHIFHDLRFVPATPAVILEGNRDSYVKGFLRVLESIALYVRHLHFHGHLGTDDIIRDGLQKIAVLLAPHVEILTIAYMDRPNRAILPLFPHVHTLYMDSVTWKKTAFEPSVSSFLGLSTHLRVLYLLDYPAGIEAPWISSTDDILPVAACYRLSLTKVSFD
jgi:hypothetical protein